jgi:hypothetical protein
MWSTLEIAYIGAAWEFILSFYSKLCAVCVLVVQVHKRDGPSQKPVAKPVNY